MTKEEKNYVIEMVKERKKAFDAVGIKVMNNSDLDIARRINDLIPVTFPVIYPVGRIITEKDALSRSCDYLDVFGDTYVIKAKDRVKNLKIYKIFDNNISFTTNITYNLDEKTRKIDKNSGNIDHMKTPKIFDEVSPMWLAHEHIHGIKELHYDEYTDGQILGDVIPMFLELVIADKEDKIKEKAYLKNRMFLLKNEAAGTEIVKDALNDHEDLYRVWVTSSMQYLNSFYYSLQLYDLYIEDREIVIKQIKEVLDGKKTTRTMLKELNLLYKYNNKKAKQGIEKVINRIR